LLVIWLATVFKVCGSPETNAIAFNSLREVTRSLGKASSGQQRQRIEAGFARLFDATFLASDTRPNAVRRERYQLMQRMRLWRENDSGATIRHWHGIVKRLWPDYPNELVRGDTILLVRGGYAIKNGRLPRPEDFGVRPLDRGALERMREVPEAPVVDRERLLAPGGR